MFNKTSQTFYWILLQHTLGYANNKILQLASHYNNAPSSIFTLGANKLRESGIINEAAVRKLSSPPIDKVEHIMDFCNENNINVIDINDPLYPDQLRNIYNAPPVLYYAGDISILKDRLLISIVGSRKPTSYGFDCAYQLAKCLSYSNVVTVSGGANGIDSACHYGSISSGKPTVLVLGCGFCTVSNKNKDMLDKVVDNGGLVLTEYDPFTNATKYTFPARNRIISGLSQGVVIIQAAEKSGALITADYALDQNRDLFVLPGLACDPNFAGSNLLIRDGANAILCADDLLQFFPDYYISSPFNKLLTTPLGTTDIEYPQEANIVNDNTDSQKEPEDREISIDISSEEAYQIYDELSQKDLTLQELIDITGFSVPVLLRSITELEVRGYIESIPGNKYTITN